MTEININTDVWVTQKAYTEMWGVQYTTLSNWIKRGKIDTLEVQELGITLVRRGKWLIQSIDEDWSKGTATLYLVFFDGVNKDRALYEGSPEPFEASMKSLDRLANSLNIDRSQDTIDNFLIGVTLTALEQTQKKKRHHITKNENEAKKAIPIKELPLNFWEIFNFSETYRVAFRVVPLPFQKLRSNPFCFLCLQKRS